MDCQIKDCSVTTYMGLKHMHLEQNVHEHLIVLKPSECKHAVYIYRDS
jgi:hypothetical protein